MIDFTVESIIHGCINAGEALEEQEAALCAEGAYLVTYKSDENNAHQ